LKERDAKLVILEEKLKISRKKKEKIPKKVKGKKNSQKR